MSDSQALVVGQVYTRTQLKDLFGVFDATQKNGIFPRKEAASVWLFVTRDPTADRTQYVNSLDGDLLRMQGQTMGRTDSAIIDHRANGTELLLFYRNSKAEYPGAGFVYEGVFEYEGHSGSSPVTFTLKRASVREDISSALDIAELDAERRAAFDVTGMEDARKKIDASIVQRRGQRTFRKALLTEYGKRCAVTGCSIEAILEAAHIFPYLGDETNHVSNGLLLRADIHTLFDLHLLSVDPETLTIVISPALRETEYRGLQGKTLRSPDSQSASPSKTSLTWHRAHCAW